MMQNFGLKDVEILDHPFLLVAAVGVEIILFTYFMTSISFPLWALLVEN